MIFSVLPLSLFVFKIVKLVHLYRTRVGATSAQTSPRRWPGSRCRTRSAWPC